jgi:Fic family protein
MAARSDEERRAIFEVMRNATDDGRYRHWDKLRHMKPPSSLDHRSWWLALKLSRASAKAIPLRDKDERAFRYNLPAPVPEHLHHIDQDIAGRVMLDEHGITNSEVRDRYVVSSLIEEAITSSQLEGAATTRQVAKEMLRTGRKPRDVSERMILNNYHGMQEIRSLIKKPLSPETILSLHRTLTVDTLQKPDACGRFRRADEEIHIVDDYNTILHEPPHASELDDRIAAMCAFANAETPKHFVHPVIRAICLHFWLAYDHPFCDGNGRCARALFYWSMLREGYWLCEFLSISHLIRKSPSQYGRAFLYTETDDNDLTYFVLYHLSILRQAIDELHRYIRRKVQEVRDVESLLRSSAELNHRQMALLSHAIRHPGMHYTIQSHRQSHQVVYQTARTDLLDLEQRNLLESRRMGRQFVFTPVDNLQKRLAAM